MLQLNVPMLGTGVCVARMMAATAHDGSWSKFIEKQFIFAFALNSLEKSTRKKSNARSGQKENLGKRKQTSDGGACGGCCLHNFLLCVIVGLQLQTILTVS